MPQYEFECNLCGERFDKQMPISEEETHECPKCGQPAPKIMSVVNSTFGWRLTEASHERFAKDEWERDI